ncbi:hypothetical protein H0O02_02005 [Candidatus Micrarchaeota archaeon]|nr:hypothetical protein [Candidatus Micrarchaeota archaeon]
MHESVKKEGAASMLSRDAPKEPLAEQVMKKVEKAKTPDWILKRYPNVPKELPKHVVDDFNAHLEKARDLVEKYEKEQKDGEMIAYYAEKAREEKRDLLEIVEEKIVFSYYMNNFSYFIFHLLRHEHSEEEMRQKIGCDRNAGGIEASNLLKNQTREEFLQTVRKANEECGLAYEKGEELYGRKNNSANVYLFPAFLKLLEMGYKRYPDLSA